MLQCDCLKFLSIELKALQLDTSSVVLSCLCSTLDVVCIHFFFPHRAQVTQQNPVLCVTKPGFSQEIRASDIHWHPWEGKQGFFHFPQHTLYNLFHANCTCKFKRSNKQYNTFKVTMKSKWTNLVS